MVFLTRPTRSARFGDPGRRDVLRLFRPELVTGLVPREATVKRSGPAESYLPRLGLRARRR